MEEKDYIKICKEAYKNAKIDHNIKSLDSLIEQYEISPKFNIIDKLREKFRLMLENIILKNQIKINNSNKQNFYNLKNALNKLSEENKSGELTEYIIEKLKENGLWQDPAWIFIKNRLKENFSLETLKLLDNLVAFNSQQSLINIKKINDEKTPIQDGLKKVWVPTGFGGGMLMLSQVVKDNNIVGSSIVLGGAVIIGVLGKEGLKLTFEATKEMIYSKDAFIYLSGITNESLEKNMEYIKSRDEILNKNSMDYKSVRTIASYINGESYLGKIHSFLLKDSEYICESSNFITKIPKILKTNEENIINQSLGINPSAKVEKLKI